MEKRGDAGRRRGARQMLIWAECRALFRNIAARVGYVKLANYLTFTGAYRIVIGV